MNPRQELKRAQGHMRACGGLFGGKSSSSSASNTTNNNIDNRLAVQDGIGFTNSSGNTANVNSTDAVKAVATLGADTLKTVGGAVVDLNRDSMQANAAAWDRTVTVGAGLVDRLIEASTSIGTAAVSNFQPAENKAQDTSLKLGMIAAAGVAATLLLSRTK